MTRKRPPRPSAAGLKLLALSLALGMTTPGLARGAQEDEAGASSEYQRRVRTPSGSAQPRVVVCEFFTQGALAPDGKDLRVDDTRGRLVPWRVLQVGPGDACRLAFQTVPGVTEYRISHGGKPSGAPAAPPTWGDRVPGLLLETRRWRACDLNRLDAVRSAFDAAEPMGADFVPTVFHRYNPTNPDPVPYLSRHRGTLSIDRPGRYTFFTSSQDASFLLVDGNLVVAWPGHHGPIGNTRFHGEATLGPGPHAFEYLHAASGPDSCMVAAWQPPGAGSAEVIPPAAFGSDRVARLPAVDPTRGGKRIAREFTYEVEGEAPVADLDQPLVRVHFRLITHGGQATRPRVRWDFGDGQTVTAADPRHVYLHPGLYTVTLSTLGEPESQAVVNRVWIGRHLEFDGPTGGPDQLASYLPIISQYDPAKLDLPGLLQLVRVFQQAAPPATAAKLGRKGLLDGREKVGELSGLFVAREVGRMLRDALDQPEEAQAFFQAAAKVMSNDEWKAECEIEAADVLLNDLLQPDQAGPVLDAAAGRAGAISAPSIASRLERVRGDWFARRGDRAAALAAYAKAVTLRADQRNTAERQAWRGALSRSTEAFLRDGELDRARDELRRWQDEFPADRAQGDLPLAQARLLVARGKLARAVAVVSDLLAVNPDAPAADQALFLAADAEARAGRTDQARAHFQSLLTDYPGSPLVSEARARISKLEAKPRPAAPTQSPVPK